MSLVKAVGKMADYLGPAKLTVEGQGWEVIQIIGPGLRQQTKETCIRLLGGFPEKVDADAYAKEYRKLEDTYDIYVVQKYRWLPIPHEVHDVGEVKYDEEAINDLLRVHDKTRTETEDWNKRIMAAHSKGEQKDTWGLDAV